MIQASYEETIELLFEHAIENEYSAAQIYKRLSKLFSHVPGLSDFWDELFQDEIRHTNILKDLQKLLTPEQLLTPADKKMWDNVTKIRRMLSKDLVEPIKTLDDAYELAHELECSEVNTVFQFLAAEFLPSGEQQKQVVSEITIHQQKLFDLNRHFGDRNWRRGIAIQRS